MVENFGGSLNLIIWIIATLGAGDYSYRCLFGTRGMIEIGRASCRERV